MAEVHRQQAARHSRKRLAWSLPAPIVKKERAVSRRDLLA